MNPLILLKISTEKTVEYFPPYSPVVRISALETGLFPLDCTYIVTF